MCGNRTRKMRMRLTITHSHTLLPRRGRRDHPAQLLMKPSHICEIHTTGVAKHWAAMATLSLHLATATIRSSPPLQSVLLARIPATTRLPNSSSPILPSMSAHPSPVSRSRLQASPIHRDSVAVEESEAQRRELDADARTAMAAAAESAQQGESEAPGAWKWAIRKRVWDLLESENVAQLPRPVHHRIPNFVGAGAAAAKLASLPAFQTARCVKVNPDTPQKQVRFLTLNGDKLLMTPQPRLRTGFFSILEAPSIPYLPDACTSAGVAKYGKPVRLGDKLKVDMIVIGSVAVDPATGARLGKGEGFAELEYGILRWMGAIDDSTLVVTTVHDRQLVDDIPVEKLLIHDVPVDVICTPTQIIHTNTRIPKPQGIYWDKLSRQKLDQIRVLRDLKKRIENSTNTPLPCAADETLPPLAARTRPPRHGTGNKTQRLTRSSPSTIFMWNVGPDTSKAQLQAKVVELGGEVQTVRTSLKPGANVQMAWVLLREGSDVGKIVGELDGSVVDGVSVRAKKDEPRRGGGGEASL